MMKIPVSEQRSQGSHRSAGRGYEQVCQAECGRALLVTRRVANLDGAAEPMEPLGLRRGTMMRGDDPGEQAWN
jgi:hypothetical protein